MFEVFEQYLKERSALTDEEIAQIRAVTVPKRLRKKQYLLQEGDISHYNAFVVKGCLRLYHVGDNGFEHILRFAIETWWMSDYESYNCGSQSKNNIDALEDSDLLLIDKKDFDMLVETVANFRILKDKLEAKSYNASQARILSNISDTAEKRYENFIKTYPDIYNRVPLHMVASYLGLTRETLSRIRSQYTKTEK
ncbi:Crp/Fnr family transcriptional regulator [Chitinophaga pinensis]|uniref:Transcriptional regulator, Crp/Fnr family n=1 Tax=Chitinophaga pinensis (strain ATCC 43595 / DSM 2588 / LMG 13176 / NBRC 15968 / NCIMB 11800 / UQM 2034) TaxID=485918 RepID=A0A979GYV0_CHIPD|nr:Crp/Fnr family transcriptional regulator [Chitinophaga pinensis]ACU62045.1 putative transcriptional regulator, Crp/Fnr family [Chitinophaga pinensis DSM 2588]